MDSTKDYDFIEECREWLRPFNYTLHSHSGEGNLATFTSIDIFQRAPVIICKKNISSTVEIRYIVSKSFFYLSSGEFQFKHPNFERFLNDILTFIKKIEK